MSNHIHKIVRFSKNSRTNLVLITEIIISFAIVSFFVFIFAKLGDSILDSGTVSFDSYITSSIFSFRSPKLTEIMTTISFLGSAPVFAFLISMSLVIFLRKNFKRYSVFSLTIFSGFGLNLLLKDVFQRPRPSLPALAYENTFSFPSAHAMDSLIFYFAFSYLIYRVTNNRKLGLLLLILSGIIVFLIGISRIYLGVHFPSDVLAGYSVGITWFLLVFLFEKTRLFIKLFHEFEK